MIESFAGILKVLLLVGTFTVMIIINTGGVYFLIHILFNVATYMNRWRRGKNWLEVYVIP